ncbi:MAG: hypothetical protein AB1405_08840 [Bdellovibrionota bacterium]
MNPIPADEQDDLDEEERAALHAELKASLAEALAGNTVSVEEVLQEIRSAR